jgi:hypothetical protein
MKKKQLLFCLLYAFFLITVVVSCRKDPVIPPPDPDYGKLVFKFDHQVNGQPLAIDTFGYVNAAGDTFSVSDIQYFISDITLHNSNGETYMIAQSNGIHYIDTDIPSTFTWTVSDDIPAANYQSVSFTFGINQVKNLSNMFVNPPESNMFWPEMMGGGYHYMKLNGSWKDDTGAVRMFNFHLGIGQIYDAINTDSVVAFVQNYFTVTLPASSFVLDSAETKEMQIVMNIESWFDTPNNWDWNFWGGSMMQNQNAQQAGKENGEDVFTIGYIH